MVRSSTVLYWENWCSASQIALKHKITNRRVQQLIKEMSENVEYGTLTIWWRKKPRITPIYRMTKFKNDKIVMVME